MPDNSHRTSPGTAIVTGGSSGIGRSVALALAARGFDLAITHLNDSGGAEEVAAEAREVGRTVRVENLDFAEPDEVERAMVALVGQLGDVRILVNNAGINPRCAVIEETVDGWMRTLQINLVSHWACSKVVARHWIERGTPGRIVNVTSVLASEPLKSAATYCSAKAGLEMLTKCLALELAPNGITVNAVAPGHTATTMNYRPEEMAEADFRLPVIPVGRSGAPEELAEAILFFAEGRGSYATGSVLCVDGGLALVTGPNALQDATDLPPQPVT